MSVRFIGVNAAGLREFPRVNKILTNNYIKTCSNICFAGSIKNAVDTLEYRSQVIPKCLREF